MATLSLACSRPCSPSRMFRSTWPVASRSVPQPFDPGVHPADDGEPFQAHSRNSIRSLNSRPRPNWPHSLNWRPASTTHRVSGAHWAGGERVPRTSSPPSSLGTGPRMDAWALGPIRPPAKGQLRSGGLRIPNVRERRSCEASYRPPDRRRAIPLAARSCRSARRSLFASRACLGCRRIPDWAIQSWGD